MPSTVKKNKLKVVLDTNIYISGLFWPGPPRTVLNFARDGKYNVFISEPILLEIEEKMVRKFRLSRDEALFLLMDILSYTNLAPMKEKFVDITVDPEDDKFFDCAVSCKADYIISGDHHLLDLKVFRDIQILKARDFLHKLVLL